MNPLTTLKATLAKATNPLLLLLLGYLDTLILLAYGQTPEAQKEIGKKAAQTVLIWIEYLEKYSASTPGEIDDKITSEVKQACEAIVAG